MNLSALDAHCRSIMVDRDEMKDDARLPADVKNNSLLGNKNP